ncbi:MAG: hypothetical protein U0Q03_22685 [Acidimicrobiales bacterium]
METYVVRVWLPDRPGALGQVASRIGALRGDVVGIDILERGGGRAVDELVVSLPDDELVDLLVGEIMQVDGVAVEDVRKVASDRPDAGMLALEVAAVLAEEPTDGRLDRLCTELAALVDGDWVAVVDATTASVVTGHRAGGSPPDVSWLSAFLDGSRHLDHSLQAAGAPGDLAWGWLGGIDVPLERDLVVVIGRRSRPFHTRERQQIALLCRMTAALIGIVEHA